MRWEDITLSEISQAQKDKYHLYSYTQNPKVTEARNTEDKVSGGMVTFWKLMKCDFTHTHTRCEKCYISSSWIFKMWSQIQKPGSCTDRAHSSSQLTTAPAQPLQGRAEATLVFLSHSTALCMPFLQVVFLYLANFTFCFYLHEGGKKPFLLLNFIFTSLWSENRGYRGNDCVSLRSCSAYWWQWVVCFF